MYPKIRDFRNITIGNFYRFREVSSANCRPSYADFMICWESLCAGIACRVISGGRGVKGGGGERGKIPVQIHKSVT